MESFREITSTVAPIDRSNIDTDAILPKQFLKRIEKRGYGQFLFYDWRFNENGEPNPAFILNKKPYDSAQILLTRENFGCGSSREHAPWALEDYGFRVIIASSYADIFYNNCFKNGILPVTLKHQELEELFEMTEGGKVLQLYINLEDQVISDSANWKTKFEVDEYRRNMLLNGLDEISSTIQSEKEITGFEQQHRIFYSL